MQTQREQLSDTQTSPDLVLSFAVFAICCIISFFAEPAVVDAVFSVNP